MLLHLREPLGDMTRFGYATGWRLGEILGLKWEYIDRRAREIRIPDSKNGEGRVLPLDEDLGKLIERQWLRREYCKATRQIVLSEHVFHLRGNQISGTTIARWWKDARLKSGLPGKIFHDLRRSAVRDMIRGGVPQTVAMKISGHKTESMFRRYNITTTTDMLEALDRRRRYVETQAVTSNVRRLSAREPGHNPDTGGVAVELSRVVAKREK